MSIEAMTQALEALELFASDESDNGQIAISAYMALQLAIKQGESKEPIGSVADTDLQGFISDDYSHILVYPKDHYTKGGVALYTAPQKREWVGLTKEEFFEIYNSNATIIKQMSMIEAKLKEKNK
jgi:hypothetical protein